MRYFHSIHTLTLSNVLNDEKLPLYSGHSNTFIALAMCLLHLIKLYCSFAAYNVFSNNDVSFTTQYTYNEDLAGEFQMYTSTIIKDTQASVTLSLDSQKSNASLNHCNNHIANKQYYHITKKNFN